MQLKRSHTGRWSHLDCCCLALLTEVKTKPTTNQPSLVDVGKLYFHMEFVMAMVKTHCRLLQLIFNCNLNMHDAQV